MVTYLIAFIVLFVLILVYFRIADHFNIIDKPNERSSHSRITLRGGGVVFYFGVLLFFLFNGFAYPWFFTGLTLIAAISFFDDIEPKSSKIRLTIHFIAMLLMFYQWDLFQMPWYFTMIALIICTGILNAWNFMDGINGITGGYSIVVIGSFWYINTFEITFVDNELIYLMLISLAVFNFFNFRKKAKCFAGDVGAVSVAFLIVFLLGLLIVKTGDFSYMILLMVYGIDSAMTIIHRLIRHENIFEAHRKHVYQIMSNELKIPHLHVSLFYMFLQAIIIAVYLLVPLFYRWFCFALVLLLLGLAYIWFMKRFFHLHVQQAPSKYEQPQVLDLI